MSTGVVIAVVAVVLALGFGGWRAVTDGRFRGTRRVLTPGSTTPAPETPEAPETVGAAATEPETTAWSAVLAALPDARSGERATLLQFSSAFCAPCRATRRVLGDVAEATPGVVHLEVDAEHHLELVRALGVLRTPTTLVLDGAGREVTRAAGAPRKEQVLDALGRA